MKALYHLIIPFLGCLLASCSSVYVDVPHNEFKSSETFPKTHTIYKNEEILKNSATKATKIVIDKENQRLMLYVGPAVAIDTPCTTGKAGKRTPSGSFTVTSKVRNKRSTIFGRCYHRGRCVHGGDKRKCRRRYSTFIGSSLPCWMRLTDTGIGIHASHGIRRYPASNGCIRVPYSIASTLYNRTDKHTIVEIQ